MKNCLPGNAICQRSNLNTLLRLEGVLPSTFASAAQFRRACLDSTLPNSRTTLIQRTWMRHRSIGSMNPVECVTRMPLTSSSSTVDRQRFHREANATIGFFNDESCSVVFSREETTSSEPIYQGRRVPPERTRLRVWPPASSHITAMRCAAFSCSRPNAFGKHASDQCFRADGGTLQRQRNRGEVSGRTARS